jgi:hypothetical protein
MKLPRPLKLAHMVIHLAWTTYLLRPSSVVALNCYNVSLVFFPNILWTQNEHPTQWDEALIAPLFKGGPDPHDISKY